MLIRVALSLQTLTIDVFNDRFGKELSRFNQNSGVLYEYNFIAMGGKADTYRRALTSIGFDFLSGSLANVLNSDSRFVDGVRFLCLE